MISCKFGKVEIEGKRSSVLSEFACLAKGMRETFGEKSIDKAYENSKKSERELFDEVFEKLKSASNDSISQLIKEFIETFKDESDETDN